MHHGMLRNGILSNAGCRFYQCLDGVDFAAYLIHARTKHGTSDFNHVLIAVQRGVNADAVFVH